MGTWTIISYPLIISCHFRQTTRSLHRNKRVESRYRWEIGIRSDVPRTKGKVRWSVMWSRDVTTIVRTDWTTRSSSSSSMISVWRFSLWTVSYLLFRVFLSLRTVEPLSVSHTPYNSMEKISLPIQRYRPGRIMILSSCLGLPDEPKPSVVCGLNGSLGFWTAKTHPGACSPLRYYVRREW